MLQVSADLLEYHITIVEIIESLKTKQASCIHCKRLTWITAIRTVQIDRCAGVILWVREGIQCVRPSVHLSVWYCCYLIIVINLHNLIWYLQFAIGKYVILFYIYAFVVNKSFSYFNCRFSIHVALLRITTL